MGSLNCKEGGETAKEPEFNYSSVNLYFFIMCVCILGEDMGMNGIMTSPVIERVPMGDGCWMIQ